MRTAKVNLNGKDHLLCFSTRVMRACVDRFGGVENIGDEMTKGTGEALDATIWLLSRLMDAGDRYAKLNGIENPPPLSEDDIFDGCDLTDLAGLRSAVQETITNGNATTVKAEASKNAEAAPGEK